MQVGGRTSARTRFLVALMMGAAALCALAPSAALAQDDPGKTTPPSITGVAAVGQTLGVTPGTTERKSPSTTTFEWRRCAPGTATCSLVGAGDRYPCPLRTPDRRSS
jgi:hypothetical protein